MASSPIPTAAEHLTQALERIDAICSTPPADPATATLWRAVAHLAAAMREIAATQALAAEHGDTPEVTAERRAAAVAEAWPTHARTEPATTGATP